VNDKFAGSQPVLSGEASVKAAKLLYRRAMGKPFKGAVKLTSGNRRTWIRHGVLSVNPDERGLDGSKGLREIIHSLAHYAHRRKHPNDAPHSARQAYIERDLVDYAIRSGWLEGKLEPKPKPPAEKPDKVRQRYAAMVKRRDKWAAELDRAKRLHAKAAKECREYERRHGDRVKG
jgi:hypothetical protein